MKKRKWMAAGVAAALLVGLTACSADPGKGAQERDTIMVYCWSEHMIYSGYAAYVQSQVTDADVVFVTGQNSMAYYEFMKENGALPDILTVRRMSMIDAEHLRDDLLDLSETETAAEFNNIYLENYRFDDGTINWLPMCGEVDGYIVNYDLFEEYDVPLPTDRASFDTACETLLSHGIVPYSNDYHNDYTCLETLQGLSIQEFMTGEGIRWRTDYESGLVRQLDTKIWRGAFERLDRQLKVWHTPKEAADYHYEDMAELFESGRAALMRGTGNDVIALKQKGMHVGMLPYFGDTAEDNWLLTYPSFNVAVNENVSKDKTKEALCMKVLDIMLSEEAQNILAGNHNMIPYNKDVSLHLDESMRDLEPYIAQNHLYLRLASAEIFRASLDAVSGMIRGEYTPEQAYDAFNRQLDGQNSSQEETCVTFTKGYSNYFDPQKGNEAASAVTNTLRQYFGSDLAIAHGVSYSGIVFASDYTQRQLNYMITDSTVRNYTKEMTGAEVRRLLETVLTSDYGGISIINRYSLPALSGCEMKVREDENGYHLEELTVNGEEIRDEDVYTVTYIGSQYQAVPMIEDLYAEEGGLEAWTLTENVSLQQNWNQCVTGSGESKMYTLEEPTDYIDVIQ